MDKEEFDRISNMSFREFMKLPMDTIFELRNKMDLHYVTDPCSKNQLNIAEALQGGDQE